MRNKKRVRASVQMHVLARVTFYSPSIFPTKQSGPRSVHGTDFFGFFFGQSLTGPKWNNILQTGNLKLRRVSVNNNNKKVGDVIRKKNICDSIASVTEL